MLQISPKWILKRLIRHRRKAESHKHFASFKEEVIFCFFQELYRKDCNLAAQLLQCSKNYDRAHKLSEVMWPDLFNDINIVWKTGYFARFSSRICLPLRFLFLHTLSFKPQEASCTCWCVCSWARCWQNHSPCEILFHPWWNLKGLSFPKPLLPSRMSLHWLPVKQRFCETQKCCELQNAKRHAGAVGWEQGNDRPQASEILI